MFAVVMQRGARVFQLQLILVINVSTHVYSKSLTNDSAAGGALLGNAVQSLQFN